MRLILDSSVVIAAERRGDTVEQLIEKIVKATGDQEAALSAIGLTELIHGLLSRANSGDTPAPPIVPQRTADRSNSLSLHERDRASSGKDRWRATEPRRGDSVRRLADRSHGAVAWLQSANGQSPRLPTHPRPGGEAVLAPA